MTKLSMILAVDRNNGIGVNNSLPWPHSKEDMAWFIRHTRGKAVLMGSKTWESLPRKPLPGRVNLVVTRSDTQYGSDTIKADTCENIMLELDARKITDCVVIGGAATYSTMFPYVTEVHVTKFDESYQCDTHFDIYSMIEGWTLVSSETKNNLTFQTWRKQ